MCHTPATCFAAVRASRSRKVLAPLSVESSASQVPENELVGAGEARRPGAAPPARGLARGPGPGDGDVAVVVDERPRAERDVRRRDDDVGRPGASEDLRRPRSSPTRRRAARAPPVSSARARRRREQREQHERCRARAPHRVSAAAIRRGSGASSISSSGCGSASDQLGHSVTVPGMLGRSAHGERVVERREQDARRRLGERRVGALDRDLGRRVGRGCRRGARSCRAARACRPRWASRPMRRWSARSLPDHSPAIVARSWVVTLVSASSGNARGGRGLEVQQPVRQHARSASVSRTPSSTVPEILAHDERPRARALERDDREQLVGARAHVGAALRAQPARDPEQAEQAHDVVDAQARPRGASIARIVSMNGR